MKTLLAALGFGIVLVSCTNSQTSDKQSQASYSTVLDTVSIPKKDSLSVYLPDIKASLPEGQTVEVKEDPVFFKAKSYKAIPLQTVLDQFLPAYKSLNLKETQIVFECEDGYNPSMSLEKVLSRKAFLAISDVEAPKGQEWINPKKGDHEMKIAPFYVVYTDVPAKDVTFKWPYNLVKISLSAASKEFKVNCLTCHSLNKVGGKMGPELNYPKSVTEYWQVDQIKQFVKAPASFRNECKMPAVTHLTDKELDEIVNYLKYMAKHKV
jgi:mono/diheme cytochrome c family protein